MENIYINYKDPFEGRYEHIEDVYNKHKSVEAFYKTGYITKEEAEELIRVGEVQRNESTILHLIDFVSEINVSCYEFDISKLTKRLFVLSYQKSSGKVTIREDN